MSGQVARENRPCECEARSPKKIDRVNMWAGRP